MRYRTNKELEDDIAKLDEQIAADRKARGLEGVPIPDKFVSGDATFTMINRCKPLERFIIKYTKLCSKSNEILPLSKEQKEWISEHKGYADLIRESVDSSLMTHGMGLQFAISLLLADEDDENKQSTSIFVREMFQAIQLILLTYETYEMEAGIYKEMSVEEFNKQYEELSKHYESIKHLY